MLSVECVGDSLIPWAILPERELVARYKLRR